MSKIQPAFENYFFRRGYVNLLATMRLSLKENDLSAQRIRLGIKTLLRSDLRLIKWIPIALLSFMILSIYVFGTVFSIIFFLIHSAVFVLISLAVYFTFALVWIADRAWISLHSIFGACPKCKEKYELPVYLCTCGREHSRLVPGKYGIFRRKCLCGKKLPTTVFSGRNKLKAKCPVCGFINGVRETPPLCITVIGGSSVGKSCYIAAVMRELVEDICPLTDTDIMFYDSRNLTEYRSMISKYEQGALQTKTSEINPLSYNFFIEKKGVFAKKLIYIYDIAGEAFEGNDALVSQKQYEYSHGFIFIIDPFSIPSVKIRYSDDDMFGIHGASTADTGDTFDVFLNALKKISAVGANRLSKKPCAVVVNKVDAYDLEQKIGLPAFESAMKNCKIRSKRAAADMVIRNFLVSNGLRNFVANLEACFSNIQFFSCSAIGHTPDGTKFAPIRTLDPFRWIVENSDKRIAGVLNDYISDKINVKIPSKMIFGKDQRYIVLDFKKIAHQNYYCLTPADRNGAPIGSDVFLASGNAKKFDTLTFFNKSNMTENATKALLELKCYGWGRKLKYYHTNQKERRT